MVLAATILRRVFVASSIVWALLLPLAPFAASRPAPAIAWYTLAFLVYGAGSVVCHQLPERSFFLWSAQWPVCARCTGIYFGAAVAALFAMTVRLKPDNTYQGITSRRARLMLLAAALPTAATLVYEWTTGDMPSHMIRALAGAPLGAAIAIIVAGALRLQRAGDPSPSETGGPSQVRRNVN
jgi:uncharacterized membrane protein